MPDPLLETMEQAADEMLAAFDVDRPPVPVELMLQRPRAGTWPEIDLSEMSATFLNLQDRYAPRMSVVRLLARNIARSQWGKDRGLDGILLDGPRVNLFARAIILPRRLLGALEAGLPPATISARFEVPEEDVKQRLKDLAGED
jgi:hypothetical protein